MECFCTCVYYLSIIMLLELPVLLHGTRYHIIFYVYYTLSYHLVKYALYISLEYVQRTIGKSYMSFLFQFPIAITETERVCV